MYPIIHLNLGTRFVVPVEVLAGRVLLLLLPNLGTFHLHKHSQPKSPQMQSSLVCGTPVREALETHKEAET